jgi:hypothetical protein
VNPLRYVGAFGYYRETAERYYVRSAAGTFARVGVGGDRMVPVAGFRSFLARPPLAPGGPFAPPHPVCPTPPPTTLSAAWNAWGS